MQEKIKTLSVIIPNYNHAQYLPGCLDAILAQSWQPEQILVIDDASTDDSLKVLDPYLQKYSHLQVLALDKNVGPAAAMNRGLEKIQGDYVAFCASDDQVLPGFFKTGMTLLQRYPQAALCMGDFYRFYDPDPETRVPRSFLPVAEPQLISTEEFIEAARSYSFYIPSQATLYSKAQVLQCGGFDEQLMSLCDFYLNLQMALRNPILYVPELLTAYRVVEASYSRHLRLQIGRRHHMCQHLMKRLASEKQDFQSGVCKSRLLAHAGLYMLAYLGYTPAYWRFFLPALCGTLTRSR